MISLQGEGEKSVTSQRGEVGCDQRVIGDDGYV
jgi:hypothetical protein